MLYFRTQYLYALAVLLACFLVVRMLVYSSFGQSLTGMRENLLRMHAVGAPVRARLVHRLHDFGGARRRGRRRCSRRRPASSISRCSGSSAPRAC